MLKHCNLITEKGDVLVLQKLFHSSYDLIILSKIATMQMVFLLSLVGKGDRVAIRRHS